MGLFSKLFKKNTSVKVTSENSSTSNPECLKLFELKNIWICYYPKINISLKADTETDFLKIRKQ